MGGLRGGQIDENITIQISTIQMSYNTNYEKKTQRRVTPESSLVVRSMVPPHPVRWLLSFFQGILEAPTESAS